MQDGYKETKIGRIPEDWFLSRASEVIQLRHGYQFRNYDFVEEEGIPIIKIGNIIDGNLILEGVSFIDSNRLKDFNDVIIKNGDLLMSLTGNIGRVVEVKGLNKPVLQNYRVGHFTSFATKLSKELLKYIISSNSFTNQLNKFSNQTAQANFGKQDLDKLIIAYPESILEQQKIAEILSTVDESIEKTDAIIEETRQLKKGLMQKLFTEGIGHTRFKETKIGRIPEDWEIKLLKEITLKIRDGNYGGSYPKADEFLDEGIPFLTSTAIGRNNKVDFKRIKYISKEKHFELDKAHIREGDILFTNRGANVGAVAMTPGELDDANIGPQLTYIRCISDEIDSLFLYYFMQSFIFKKQIESLDTGTAMNFFSIGTTQKFKILIPSLNEQKQVSKVLFKVDSKIEKEEATKAELEQLKKGLMQVLLTGKVRVKA